jgi:hypothetical protein
VVVFDTTYRINRYDMPLRKYGLGWQSWKFNFFWFCSITKWEDFFLHMGFKGKYLFTLDFLFHS